MSREKRYEPWLPGEYPISWHEAAKRALHAYVYNGQSFWVEVAGPAGQGPRHRLALLRSFRDSLQKYPQLSHPAFAEAARKGFVLTFRIGNAEYAELAWKTPLTIPEDIVEKT